MSLELINAVASGDKAKVKELLKNPSVDINFSILLDGFNYPVTALVVAMLYQKWEIAEVLIHHKARLCSNAETYAYPEISINPYVYAMTQVKQVDLGILKLLLRHVENLHFSYQNEFGGFSSILHHINHPNCDDVNKGRTLLYEALLRGDIRTIDEHFKTNCHPDIDVITFGKYLEFRKMTHKEMVEAKNAIHYYFARQKLPEQEAEKFKKCIDFGGLCKFENKVEALPEPLQKRLSQHSKRSLNELFCELQYHLSMHAIPGCSVDSEIFNIIDKSTYDISPEGLSKLRAQQNPLTLRSFLNLNPTAILMHLNTSTTDEGDNPAALLLAEILIYHANTKLDDAPLLSEAQKQAALTALSALYSLTNNEKILLHMHREQKNAIAELVDQNRVLQSNIKELTEKFDKLMSVLSPEPQKKSSLRFIG